MQNSILCGYAKEIVNISFAEPDGSHSAIVGVPLFSKNGFAIYTGLDVNCYCGQSKYHSDLQSLQEDTIKYFMLVSVFDKTTTGVLVSSWLQGGWPHRYNNIKNFLYSKTSFHPFCLSPHEVTSTSDRYPHRCPKCGKPAYIGLFSVDCSSCNG
jgi:hypothetical protein